jgi:hypothetical protein
MSELRNRMIRDMQLAGLIEGTDASICGVFANWPPWRNHRKQRQSRIGTTHRRSFLAMNRSVSDGPRESQKAFARPLADASGWYEREQRRRSHAPSLTLRVGKSAKTDDVRTPPR